MTNKMRFLEPLKIVFIPKMVHETVLESRKSSTTGSKIPLLGLKPRLEPIRSENENPRKPDWMSFGEYFRYIFRPFTVYCDCF